MDDLAATAMSPLEEQDIFLRIKQWHSSAQQHQAKWRDETRENYSFVAGDQYDEKDKARLKELVRPCLTFNRIGPVIDSVSGMEVNNRQEVRYIPRTEGDAKVNEQLTAAAAWVRDECDAEDEESDAFIDLLIGGMGWTETRIEYETDPDGAIRVERVDPFEMYWDPSARRRNLDDARYVLRIREMDIADAKAMFPDEDESSLHAVWTSSDGMEGKPIDREAAREYESDGGSKLPVRGRVRICEAQWWELEPFWRVIDPLTNKLADLDEAEYKKISQKVTLQSVRQQRRSYKRAFVGTKLLEGGEAPCKGHFTYRCMTGKRDRNTGTWYGLVRAMKDPQRYANKLMSSALHIMSTSGKGIMAEASAIDDIREFEADFAHPDKVVTVADGALSQGRIEPKPGGTIPPGLPDLLMQSISAIRDTSGVNLEMLGMADRQQAGVLEAQRKQSAMTVLATLFDSLRRYRKEQGRVLLYYIMKYLNDGRLMRITSDEGDGYQPFRIDDQTIKYDVIVDQSATSPNQKEQTWAILTQSGVMPLLMKQAIPPELWYEILKVSPLPESFATKVKEIMAKESAKPKQPSPEEMKAKTAIEMGQQEMVFKQQDAELEKVKFAQQLQHNEHLHQQEMRHLAEKNQAEMAVHGMEAQQKMATKGAMSEQQIQLKREQSMMAALNKANGKSAKGIDPEADKEEAEILAQGIEKLAESIVQLAKAQSEGDTRIIQAITAPKVVKTPDGRVYTSETATVN